MRPQIITSALWPRPFSADRAWGPMLQPDARARHYDISLEIVKTELGLINASQVTLCTSHRRLDLGADGWPTSALCNALTHHPGVQLAFTCHYGWLHFLCDAIAQWELNFRALGETLQSLNGINMLGLLPEGVIYQPFSMESNPFAAGPQERSGSRSRVGDRVSDSVSDDEDDEDAEFWQEVHRSRARRAAAGSRSAASSHSTEDSIPPTVPDAVLIAGTWLAARSDLTIKVILGSHEGLQRAYRAAARRLHPDVEEGSHEAFLTLKKYHAVVETHLLKK